MISVLCRHDVRQQFPWFPLLGKERARMGHPFDLRRCKQELKLDWATPPFEATRKTAMGPRVVHATLGRPETER